MSKKTKEEKSTTETTVETPMVLVGRPTTKRPKGLNVPETHPAALLLKEVEKDKDLSMRLAGHGYAIWDGGEKVCFVEVGKGQVDFYLNSVKIDKIFGRLASLEASKASKRDNTAEIHGVKEVNKKLLDGIREAVKEYREKFPRPTPKPKKAKEEKKSEVVVEGAIA